MRSISLPCAFFIVCLFLLYLLSCNEKGVEPELDMSMNLESISKLSDCDIQSIQVKITHVAERGSFPVPTVLFHFYGRLPDFRQLTQLKRFPHRGSYQDDDYYELPIYRVILNFSATTNELREVAKLLVQKKQLARKPDWKKVATSVLLYLEVYEKPKWMEMFLNYGETKPLFEELKQIFKDNDVATWVFD